MIVLGIDPGIAITGVGIVEQKNSHQSLIFSTAIITTNKVSFAERITIIYSEIIKIIKTYSPNFAVLESLFFNTNAKTALLVGQARGVIQLALYQEKIPISEYTPLEVKIALTGYGRADKPQIQMMVKRILNLPNILKPDDVADAAAIAITHCFNYKLQNKINAKINL